LGKLKFGLLSSLFGLFGSLLFVLEFLILCKPILSLSFKLLLEILCRFLFEFCGNLGCLLDLGFGLEVSLGELLGLLFKLSPSFALLLGLGSLLLLELLYGFGFGLVQSLRLLRFWLNFFIGLDSFLITLFLVDFSDELVVKLMVLISILLVDDHCQLLELLLDLAFESLLEFGEKCLLLLLLFLLNELLMLFFFLLMGG
jgi:hypothetical protein